jgi:hypothetical protein
MSFRGLPSYWEAEVAEAQRLNQAKKSVKKPKPLASTLQEGVGAIS